MRSGKFDSLMDLCEWQLLYGYWRDYSEIKNFPQEWKLDKGGMFVVTLAHTEGNLHEFGLSFLE